jgi:hypothetical protein
VVSSKKQSSARTRSQQQRTNARKGSNGQQGATAPTKQPGAPKNARSKDTQSKNAQKKVSARERVAAARAAERRRERRRWLVTFGATGAIVVALGAGAAWAITANGNKQHHAAASAGTGKPPWPVPADTVANARRAGLNIAPMEGTAQHIHAHLDVFVNGQKVSVPANLGIAGDGSQLAEMHTHDDTGVIHMESPSKDKKFTLGEVFAEWNVRLSPTQIGGLTTDATHTLTVYVNGKPQAGDPAAIQLAAHQEIALVYGPKGATNVKVPSSYKWDNGL